QPPFVSDNFHELAARHINDVITPPAQRGSKLGAWGDAIVLKLLARSPAERYGSLEEVLGALGGLERALQAPAGPAAGPAGRPAAAPAAPLLRDASLAHYQPAQSVLNIDRSEGSFFEGPGGATLFPASAEMPPTETLPVIPGYEILGVLGRGAMGKV